MSLTNIEMTLFLWQTSKLKLLQKQADFCMLRLDSTQTDMTPHSVIVG
jgi:hypothetical protein